MVLRKQWKQRKRVGRMAVFTVISLFFLYGGGSKAFCDINYDEPWVHPSEIYGNGFPLLIEAGSKENTTTIKCDKDRDGTYETALVKDQDLYSERFIVWGGGQNKTVENTSITMTGGKVNKIIGGGCEKPLLPSRR